MTERQFKTFYFYRMKNKYEFFTIFTMQGGGGIVVRAPGCDDSVHGFDSLRVQNVFALFAPFIL